VEAMLAALLAGAGAWLDALEQGVGPRVFAWLGSLSKVLAIYAGFLLVERLRPAQRGQRARSVLFNLRWVVLYSALTGLLMFWVFGALTRSVSSMVGGPLVSLSAASGLAQLAELLLFYCAFDFFYYWFHRMQHRVPLLWRQHRLHHTEQDLNVTTTQRHHWLEEPLRVFFITIPMALLIDVGPAKAGWIGFSLGLWGFFIHANLRLSLGPLSPVFVGPQVHRIHHSVLRIHQDRNFGAFFPIWDILFGTFHRPAPDEYPPTGIEGVEPPRSLLEASLDPFVGPMHPLRRESFAGRPGPPDAERESTAAF